MSDEEKSGVIRKLIDAGAEIAGGAVGGALGFLAAGPAGAAALGAGGAMAAVTLKRLGHEASERLLAPREKTRVGAVLAVAADEIRRRAEAGDHVRSDGFFDQEAHGRSKADEVAEAVLIKSQREPEEKKIHYLGVLLASVSFHADISSQMAHQIVKTAEDLTYRQFCLLKLAATKERFGLRTTDYRGQTSFEKPLYQLLYECLDLYHRALVNFGGEVAFGPTDVAPGNMTIQGLGADMFNLMKLREIPDEDLLPLIQQLRAG
jgi:hypothetical protein